MVQKFTTYVTYSLENTTLGYSNAIHCNYIQKFGYDTTINQQVNIFFNDEKEFQFLSTNNGGTGFTANKICMLIQVVENQVIGTGNFNAIDATQPTEYEETPPKPDAWRCFDVTDQIDGHVPGDYLTPTQLATTIFRVPLLEYQTATGDTYNLGYLNYPPINNAESLSFGDEEFFLGNVETEIEASVYTTDLAINLPLGEFNSTTNPTWDGQSEVYITEVGIFNEEKELIAIGKLNNPLKKNNAISRTIVFGIDF